MNLPLIHENHRHRRRKHRPHPQPQPSPAPSSEIVWPTYAGAAQLVGTSPIAQVSIYVDPSLGPAALQNATDLLADADRVAATNNTIFGATGSPVNVIVFALSGQTDGTGGADHMACDFVTGGNIEVCASFGNSMRCSALFEAELSECAMGGNLCGLSTGEALSRWCAMVASNNALADFVTAPAWWGDGGYNWVDQTNPTDQDPDATGCGMAFISWLRSQGSTIDAIAQAMVKLGNAGTLAQLYGVLGHDASAAWTNFIDALNALPNGVTSDDPFGAVA